jgi:hypothetical protein
VAEIPYWPNSPTVTLPCSTRRCPTLRLTSIELLSVTLSLKRAAIYQALRHSTLIETPWCSLSTAISILRRALSWANESHMVLSSIMPTEGLWISTMYYQAMANGASSFSQEISEIGQRRADSRCWVGSSKAKHLLFGLSLGIEQTAAALLRYFRCISALDMNWIYSTCLRCSILGIRNSV